MFKGEHTLVAANEGVSLQTFQNTTGSVALAKAGSGDLLAGIIGALQMMGNIVAIAGDASGPKENLPFFALQIYGLGFGYDRNVGYACALAWLLFVIIGILTAFIFKGSGWVYYGDGGDK